MDFITLNKTDHLKLIADLKTLENHEDNDDLREDITHRLATVAREQLDISEDDGLLEEVHIDADRITFLMDYYGYISVHIEDNSRPLELHIAEHEDDGIGIGQKLADIATIKLNKAQWSTYQESFNMSLLEKLGIDTKGWRFLDGDGDIHFCTYWFTTPDGNRCFTFSFNEQDIDTVIQWLELD